MRYAAKIGLLLAGASVTSWGCAGMSGSPGIGSSASGTAAPGARMAGSVAQGTNTPAPQSTGSKVAGAMGLTALGNGMKSAYRKTADVLHPKPEGTIDPISLDAPAKPLDAKFHTSLAQMQDQAGQHSRARELYRKALQLDPDYFPAHLGIARSLDRQGQLASATTAYLEVTRRFPKESTAWNDLGMCYARQQQLPAAIEALSQAVALEDERPLYRNNMAKLLTHAGRPGEALVHLQTVHPASVAHYNLGVLLAECGQPREALDQFAQAHAMDPTLDEARQWSEKLVAQMSQAAVPSAIEELESEPSQDDKAYYAVAEEALAVEADANAADAPGTWDSGRGTRD